MLRREKIAELKPAAPVVLPSLLLCDFGNLAAEIRALEDAGVRALHLDVMDGHFVPNLTYGLTIVEAVRRLTELPLDVHLMISNPEEFVERYFEAGADAMTVHVEATQAPRELLEQIRDTGAAAGIALNPPTPVEAIDACLDCCDLILVMSVMPGFGAQQFDDVALEKLRRLKPRIRADAILEVDGGINTKTIAACAAAGAEGFVVGSGIFKYDNYADRVAQLRELAATPSTADGRKSC
jgi:ribulose-phosphate 3-epimerase